MKLFSYLSQIVLNTSSNHVITVENPNAKLHLVKDGSLRVMSTFAG